MKTVLIITGIIVVLFFVFQIYLLMAIKNTETQACNLIKEEKDFEIRYYPAATMAMITSSAKTYSELGRSGFSQLAGYIFGGNKEKRKIAMTSPVHMDISDSVSGMSFVMPSGSDIDNLPQPDNPAVTIRTVPGEYVAAIKFGGFVSSEKIKKYIALLQQLLEQQHLVYSGAFRVLGYNPPFQLLGRRNEIVVSIQWDAKKTI